MKRIMPGNFFGITNSRIAMDSLILTDTEYTLDKVDWHYHEHAYFTFVVQGKLIEGTRQAKHHCSAGSLLLHNWQEPHYNIKPPGYARGFHIEMDKEWFRKYDIKESVMEGSNTIEAPLAKILFHQLRREMKLECQPLAIDTLLLNVLDVISSKNRKQFTQAPKWVSIVKDILHSNCAQEFTLKRLAETVSIHPVHLSRDFKKYFGCNLGDYLRKLRIEKAMHMMAERKSSLTEIAYACGFADQSHFLRWFKRFNSEAPSDFQRIMG